MKGTPATYLGQIVSRDHFRVFIYDTLGNKQLVESYDEFESKIATGIWFDTLEKANLSVVKEEKPRRTRAKSEVVEDDFLPKEGK